MDLVKLANKFAAKLEKEMNDKERLEWILSGLEAGKTVITPNKVEAKKIEPTQAEVGPPWNRKTTICEYYVKLPTGQKRFFTTAWETAEQVLMLSKVLAG